MNTDFSRSPCHTPTLPVLALRSLLDFNAEMTRFAVAQQKGGLTGLLRHILSEQSMEARKAPVKDGLHKSLGKFEEGFKTSMAWTNLIEFQETHNPVFSFIWSDVRQAFICKTDEQAESHMMTVLKSNSMSSMSPDVRNASLTLTSWQDHRESHVHTGCTEYHILYRIDRQGVHTAFDTLNVMSFCHRLLELSDSKAQGTSMLGNTKLDEHERAILASFQQLRILETMYRSLLGEKVRYRIGMLGAHLDLFFLCVISNQKELAFELWKQCEFPVRAAIVAVSRICARSAACWEARTPAHTRARAEYARASSCTSTDAGCAFPSGGGLL